MGAYVVKPVRDRDEYVIWSTVTESPYFVGDRDATLAWLHEHGDATDQAQRIDRADEWGTSALWPSHADRYLGWDSTTIYEQTGIIRTADMAECARRLTLPDGEPGVCYQIGADMSDLLEPLE